MDLRQLMAFEAVAQTSSFSQAADRLQLTQSTVSSTIRTLEREWGLALFHRTSHRVELTADGRTLLPIAQATLAQARTLDEAVHQTHGALIGELRIGIMHTAPSDSFSIASDIAAYAQRHPGVDIHLKQAASSDQLAMVARGDADLAYAAATGLHHPGVSLTELSSDEMQLACHAEHPLARRQRRITLDKLLDVPLAEFPVGWGARAAIDRAFDAQGLQRTVAYEMNDCGTITDFVRNRLAVAILPPFPLAPGDSMVWRRLGPGAPHFTRSLVTPTSRPIGAAAKAFVDLVCTPRPQGPERPLPASGRTRQGPRTHKAVSKAPAPERKQQ